MPGKKLGAAGAIGRIVAKRAQDYADARDIDVTDEMLVNETEMFMRSLKREQLALDIVKAAKETISHVPTPRKPRSENGA